MWLSWLLPFFESCHAVLQIASSFKPGICQGDNVDLGKRMADQCAEVLGKSSKGVIATLNDYRQHKVKERRMAARERFVTTVASRKRTYLESVDEYKK